MANFLPGHFSGTVRTSKDDLRFGPLKWSRVNATPPNIYGRNGDIVIVDNTAETDEATAINRTPTDTFLCQKNAFLVAGGDFTITTASGVFTITIATIDDFIREITQAAIPELRVEYTNPKSPTGGNNFLLHANTVTFADGTSDLPSVLGITGVQAGEIVVATGQWKCLTFGVNQVDISSSGTLVAGTPFSNLNFTGTGVTSVVDAGTGRVDITISGGAGGGVAYGVIAGGDGGSATATSASELITFNGTGISITSTNAGIGLDTVDFGMDISDLPAGAGPLAASDEIAINDGGTTERHTISDVVEAALPGLTITIINGQPTLTLEDTTRANKILSISEQSLVYAENAVGEGAGDDWLRIGNTNDIDSGYIMDFDGTLVYGTVHTENGTSGTKDFRLFINAVDNGVIVTTPAALNGTDENATLDIDFAQGDRIRIRADAGAGNVIQDTVVKLTTKWRG
jgi:hypothetical protein